MDSELVMRALNASKEFFEARDRMNAKVHLDEPRYSPITVLVKAALEQVDSPAPPREGTE